jgi:hypothetical protein
LTWSMTARTGGLGRPSAPSDRTVTTAPGTGRPSEDCTVIETDPPGTEAGTADGALMLRRTATTISAMTTAVRHVPRVRRPKEALEMARWSQRTPEAGNPLFWRAEGLIPAVSFSRLGPRGA